jgi:transcriptional regulator with XRE-family HTH domain
MGNDINKIFGQHVAKLRKEAGFSQERFAFHCHLDRTYIGTIERGEKSPTLNTILKIASGLNMSLKELFDNL